MATACPVVVFNPLPFSVVVTDRSWHKAGFTRKWHFSRWMRFLKIYSCREPPKLLFAWGVMGLGISLVQICYLILVEKQQGCIQVFWKWFYIHVNRKKKKITVLGVACRKLLLWQSFPCIPNATLKEPGNFLHGMCRQFRTFCALGVPPGCFSAGLLQVPLLSA